RNHEAKRADSMIQLGTEPSLFDQGRQVLTGGEHEPDAGRSAWPEGSGSLNIVHLELAHELELKLTRQRAYVLDMKKAAACLGQLLRPDQEGAGMVNGRGVIPV